MAASERPTSKVIIQVVGAVITAAVLYFCRSWLPAIWHWLVGVLTAIWHFLIASYPIPGWLLLIFVAFSLAVVFRTITAFRQPSKPREPSDYDYTEDRFF